MASGPVSPRRRPPRTAAMSLAALAGVILVAVPLLAGCSSKDETPPASSGYYTGPMKPKGAPSAPGAATAPTQKAGQP